MIGSTTMSSSEKTPTKVKLAGYGGLLLAVVAILNCVIQSGVISP